MNVIKNNKLDLDYKFSKSEINKEDLNKVENYIEKTIGKKTEDDFNYSLYTIIQANSLAVIKAEIMLMESFSEKDTDRIKDLIYTNFNLGFLYKKGLTYFSTSNLKEKVIVEKNKNKSDFYFTKAREDIFKLRGILKSKYSGYKKLGYNGTRALCILQLQLAYIYHLGLGVDRNQDCASKLYKQLIDENLLDEHQIGYLSPIELDTAIDRAKFLNNNLDLENIGYDSVRSALHIMSWYIPCDDFFSNEFTYIHRNFLNYYNNWTRTKKFLRQLSNSFTEQREILETSFTLGNTEAFFILGHLYKTGVLVDKYLINKYHKPARGFEKSIPKSNYCFEQIFKFSESVLTSTKDIEVLFQYYSTFLEIFKQDNNNHIELLNQTFDKIHSYYFDESNFHNSDPEYEDQESKMDSFRKVYSNIRYAEKAGKHFKILNDKERLNKIKQIYENCLERFENDKDEDYEEENQKAIDRIIKVLKSFENDQKQDNEKLLENNNEIVKNKNKENIKKNIQEKIQGDRIAYSYSWNYKGNTITKTTLVVHSSHYLYKLLSEFEDFSNQLGDTIDLYFDKGLWKAKYVSAKLQDIGDLCLKTVLEGIKENDDPMGLGKLDLKRMFFDPDFYVLIGCRVTLKNNLHYVEPRKLVVEEDIKFFEENGYWRHTKDIIRGLRDSDPEKSLSNKINKDIEDNNKKISKKVENKQEASKPIDTRDIIKSIEDREGVTIELIKSILRKGNFQYRETQGFIEDSIKMRKGGFFKSAQPAPTLNQLKSLYLQYNPSIENKFPGHANVIFSKEIVEYLDFYVDNNNQVHKK